MENQFSRTRQMLGQDALDRLAGSRVAVFGLGGVGGYAMEALVRAGIGAIDLIDHDRVSPSNLNRQIIATFRTLGMLKVEAASERAQEINPDCDIRVYPVFFLPETRGAFDFSVYDYVLDAIDNVTGKLTLIESARAVGTPIISCMGTGNKLDPTALRVGDLYETSVCPLARIMRRECRRRGIDRLKVVYSTEEPLACPETGEALPASLQEEGRERRHPPGSVSFVPGAAGLIMAGEVIRDLIRR